MVVEVVMMVLLDGDGGAIQKLAENILRNDCTYTYIAYSVCVCVCY